MVDSEDNHQNFLFAFENTSITPDFADAFVYAIPLIFDQNIMQLRGSSMKMMFLTAVSFMPVYQTPKKST